MDANTDKTTRCGTVSAERFSKSGSESVQKIGDMNINTRDIRTLRTVELTSSQDRPSDP